MLDDYSITNSDNATTQYLQIINILKRENLLDVIGEQGHAFSTTGSMASCGLPINGSSTSARRTR
jgi:endo-1,4-beta-xylanase